MKLPIGSHLSHGMLNFVTFPPGVKKPIVCGVNLSSSNQIVPPAVGRTRRGLIVVLSLGSETVVPGMSAKTLPVINRRAVTSMVPPPDCRVAPMVAIRSPSRNRRSEFRDYDPRKQSEET